MEALRIIKREHRNLGAVLTCMEMLVREIDQHGKQPDNRVFHAILTYLDSFLDRFHHPKENKYLFPALCLRYPQAEPMVRRLEEEHCRGEMLADELRKALSVYEFMGDEGFPEFRDAALRYVEFEREHAYTEEREILPRAVEHLTEDDWAEIDAAFSSNDDPLFGESRRKEYAALAKTITNIAPAPHGLGDAWRSK